MLLKSEGIVLHSIKYGESSQISKVLSKEKGLISLLSSRHKSKKNKKTNYFEPLSSISFVCYLSNKSTLHRVKEVQFNNSQKSTNRDIVLTSIRFFLAEFLTKVVKEEEQNVSLYNFIEKEVFLLFSLKENIGSFHITFLSKLCHQIGITPDFSEEGNYFDFYEGSIVHNKPKHEDFCEGHIKTLLNSLFNKSQLYTKSERAALLNNLIKYYNIQLGGGIDNLKSKTVLEVVFS